MSWSVGFPCSPSPGSGVQANCALEAREEPLLSSSIGWLEIFSAVEEIHDTNRDFKNKQSFSQL